MQEFKIFSIMVPWDTVPDDIFKEEMKEHILIEFRGYGNQKYSRSFWDQVGRYIGLEFFKKLTE